MASTSPAVETTPYREMTIPAMVIGIIMGAVLTASFVYIGLLLGFTMSGSTVAAILGFAALKGLTKHGTILENNIAQTVASGVNNASSGVVFTMPALFIMGIDDFDPVPFILAAVAGSFLGIVLIIPLRKQMIEFERLRFPSGVAVGTLLKSPGAGLRQAKLLGVGFFASAFFTCLTAFHVLPEDLDIGVHFGLPATIPIVIYVSFASLGAGLLAGRGGLSFFAGGILAWWIISPIAVSMGWVPDVGIEGQDTWQSGVIYSQMLRPLGIGMLVGGALMGVVLSFPALKSAIKGLSSAVQTRSAGAAAQGKQEMSARVLSVGLGAGVLMLFVAALLATDEISVLQALSISIVGTIWLALAGLVVAQATGMTDISPLSGMSLIAVTIMFFMTAGSTLASVLLGVAVCIGIGQCADMMSDLKSGHLVGSVPRRQQLAQMSVAWIGPPIAVAMLALLWSAEGFGPGMRLSAPQGQALAAILESLGAGEAALDKYLSGMALGGAVGLFPIGGVGVLVGLAMYLPFSITLTYGIGCLISMWLGTKLDRRRMGTDLVPVAAGFIIGEALPRVVIVIAQVVSGGGGGH